MFFFEKKNQKTFAPASTRPASNRATYAREQKFFASFFQKRSAYVFSAGAALTALPHGQAHAQLLERYYPANVPAYQDWFATVDTSGVGDAYQPNGVRVGSFVIRPSVTEGFGYDSNLTGTPAGLSSPDVKSDGAITLDSDWSRDSFHVAVLADDVRYLNYPNRSYTSWTASTGGTIDYGDDKIGVAYAHLNTVTLPTDVGNFGVQGPITGQVDDLRISDTIGPGRFTLVPAVTGDLYSFSTTGGPRAAAAQTLVNRDVVNASLTAGYEFAGGHNLLVILDDSEVGYGSGAPGIRPPNYNDVSLLAGIEFRQSALFSYRALVGYETRFLNGHPKSGDTITAPAAELDVIWTPTVLTSVTGRLVQSLQDEPAATGQGVKQTTGRVTVEYAFRRNVILDASAEYDRVSFPTAEGTQAGYQAAASAHWLLTRNWSLSLSYDFTKADDSSGGMLGFTRHQVLLQAKFQL
jgi:hypothetical protein